VGQLNDQQLTNGRAAIFTIAAVWCSVLGGGLP